MLTVHVVLVLVGGGYPSLASACRAVESKVPVLVIMGTGQVADVIAKALARKERQSVIKTRKEWQSLAYSPLSAAVSPHIR